MRGSQADVPAVKAALEAIPYDRGAVQVVVEFDPLNGHDIAVDVETYRGISATTVTASLIEPMAGWSVLDSDEMASAIEAEMLGTTLTPL